MRTRTAVSASVAVAAGSIAVAGPADATHDAWDVGNGVCQDFEVCAYEHDNYGGLRADFHFCGSWGCGYADFSAYDYYHTSVSPNDKTSSVWNRTLKHAQFSTDSFGGGYDYCFGPGGGISSGLIPQLNDEWSSLIVTENPQWYTSCNGVF